jgi:hypothetical protein
MNVVVSIIMVEYAIIGMKPLKQTTKEHKERDKKYSAFVRDDLDYIFNPINRPIMYLMAPTIFPKYLICWGSFAVLAIIS